MPEPEPVLLLGDADAIKEYVFESSALPQMRGGSQRLIECEELVRAQVVALGGSEIYCAGGSFLFEIPVDQADSVTRSIERIYYDQTRIASVTVVVEDRRPGPAPNVPLAGWADRLRKASRSLPLDGGFAHRVALLGARLRQAKAEKTVAPFFETLPFWRRCDLCGKRAATLERPRSEPGGPALDALACCPVCFDRDRAGRVGEGETRGKFNNAFRRFAQPKARQAPDLDHLVAGAKRTYLACLYADGNDIGGLLQKARSREEYQALSHALQQSVQNALFTTLAEVCGPALEIDGCWPFEIVNVGGDDVTVLLQAGYAWEVAVAFLDRFEQGVRWAIHERLGRWPEDWPSKVTASCGIAIADAKYPIRFLRELAEGLLKSAKRRAKKDPLDVQSAVDFLWLPNPIVSPHVDTLMARYRRDDLNLTARPYTLAQAHEIRRLTVDASSWPPTQRHHWAEALEHGVLISLNAISYNVARRSDEDRVQMIRFLADVGQLAGETAPPGGSGAQFWRVDVEEGQYRTALLDVLELAELRSLRPDVTEAVEVSQ